MIQAEHSSAYEVIILDVKTFPKKLRQPDNRSWGEQVSQNLKEYEYFCCCLFYDMVTDRSIQQVYVSTSRCGESFDGCHVVPVRMGSCLKRQSRRYQMVFIKISDFGEIKRPKVCYQYATLGHYNRKNNNQRRRTIFLSNHFLVSSV